MMRETDEGLTVFALKSKCVILLRLSHDSDVSQTIEPRIALFCWSTFSPALRLIFDLPTEHINEANGSFFIVSTFSLVRMQLSVNKRSFACGLNCNSSYF